MLQQCSVSGWRTSCVAKWQTRSNRWLTKLKAQEQHMREQGEQMKGQVQQVMDLEQQVAGLHSKLKEEQKGKAAAVKVSTSTQYPSASTSKVALLAAVTPSYDHRLCHCQSHACIICVITLRRLLH